METGLCSDTAAEYIRRKDVLVGIARTVVPFAGELLYLNHILLTRHRNDPVVLCYHGVVPDEIAEDPHGYGALVSISEFSEQMSILARTMTPISLSELDNWLHGNQELPRNPVLVTFDDGYRNNIVHAAPVLLKLGIPAVFFPTVSHIGTDRLLWPTEVYHSIVHWPSSQVPLPDGSTIDIPSTDLQKRTALAEWVREFCKTLYEELRSQYVLHLRGNTFPALTADEAEMFSFLSWEETTRLHSMGFAIGSHTMDHLILTRICPSQLRRELEVSKQELEKRLKASCISIAYPNGGLEDYSPQILSATTEAGYRLGFTVVGSACTRDMDPMALNRICIPGGTSRLGFQSRISGLHSLMKMAARKLIRLQNP